MASRSRDSSNPPPPWAPAVFWTGVVVGLAWNVMFFATLNDQGGLPAYADLLLPATFGLFGWYCVLDPERIQRLGAYGAGRTVSGTRAFGASLIVAAILFGSVILVFALLRP